MIDAGARYGLHPTWSDYKAPLVYCCFEPDPQEAERLEKKYREAGDRVRVECCALAEKPQMAEFHRLRHHAASGFYRPAEDSIWYNIERPDEGEVLETFQVSCTTIDIYCENANLKANFLKLDTEGSELRILEGAEGQLRQSVLGVRSEISFDASYEGQALFPEIHRYLLDLGFFLVNLDYDGRGVRRSDFVDEKRYGTLLDSDGVWVKRPEQVLEDAIGKPEIVLKFAAFCFANHAPDLGLDTLLQFERQQSEDYWALRDARLFEHLAIVVEDHFYQIRNLPGRGLNLSGPIYERLFGRSISRMHEYYEGRS